MSFKIRKSRWFLSLVSIVVAFILSVDLWIYLAQGYEGDSFYTLGRIERTGLMALTLFLSGILLIVRAYKSHYLHRFRGLIAHATLVFPVLDLCAAFSLFYLFVWLSPQVYYLYYFIIFNDLPLQLVIKEGPEILQIVKLLTMNDQPVLSLHGQGLLGRSLIIQIILCWFNYSVCLEGKK